MTLTWMPLRSSRPAMSSTIRLVKTIRASPSCTSSGKEKGTSSQSSRVLRSYLWTSKESPHSAIKWVTTSSAEGLKHTWTSAACTPRMALVQEWPLSESAIICASSMTATSYLWSRSSISTVEEMIRLFSS